LELGIFPWQVLSPLRLLGPLSDRELRIASRRLRSYALRSGYILLLCILMLSAWYRIVGLPDSTLAAFGVSRASVVSQHVASQVLMFQFAAAQFIAAVMLSSSFGDELRRGTFSVLMTTPITSTHIVLGKLMGGLVQAVLLLAISLPVLAVLRIFGGVTWDSVLAGFCITLTAAGFMGVLSLLLSTYYRHPFAAVSAGALVYLILFAGLPFAVACWIVIGGVNQPAALLHLLLLVAWLTCFVIGAGLYFSSRFTRTTSAVVASFALVVGLWIVGPTLAGLIGVTGGKTNVLALYRWIHPMTQVQLILAGATGTPNAGMPWRSLTYGTRVLSPSGGQAMSVVSVTGALAGIATAYILAGLLFLRGAQRCLRRRIFG